METLSLNSIGCVAQTLQRSPNQIVTAAEQLGLKPTARINGVSHYSDAQVGQLQRHFSALLTEEAEKE